MEKENLLVITSYPPYGTTHHQSIVGIAACAKNTLESLKKKNPNLAITVLAEKLRTQDKKIYMENGMTIKRLWQRNSFITFPLFFKEILTTPNTKNIMFQFGFSIYGNLPSLLLLPIFLLLFKCIGKKVTFVLHEVVPSASEVSGHIHINNRLVIALYDMLFKVFYKMVVLLSWKVIVFEEIFKKRLNNSQNIVVIPIGIETISKHIDTGIARNKLHLNKGFLVMTFGYFAWYKGTDWIANVFTQINNMTLLIAGGENPNRTELPAYNTYVKSILTECKTNNITVTGFIPEEELPLYFAASDVVIFPYRTFMGASASLAMTCAFQKPFLISTVLENIFETKDFKNVFTKTALDKKDYIFSLSKTSLIEHLNTIKRDPLRIKTMAKVAKDIAESRSWNHIGSIYYEAIFA